MLTVRRNLRPTISRFFDDDWNSLFDWSNRNLANNSLPAVNIKETANEFIVEMAAPGMTKEDFQVELNENVLTIKCEVQQENNTENDNFLRQEFNYQAFQRTFNLNKHLVDDGQIQAKYDNGILSLILPKKEEAKEKASRIIEIS